MSIFCQFHSKFLHVDKHFFKLKLSLLQPKLIIDVKRVNRLLFLYIPLPLFWALFDQQGSRWTLQAGKMDGKLSDSVSVKPDQMQAINAILIVIMIPIFEYGIYPFLARFNILTRPLQRMTVGGLLAAVSFVLAAFIQLKIENSTPGSVSMLWQIGQYAVITCGELMFSITGLEFSYSQVSDVFFYLNHENT